ncbi:transposase, mutator type [Mycobacteroides abscessus subsp. abscessus]|nr:transposase, mutator type [Mycobacteroides abscessus subsp. abscessus]
MVAQAIATARAAGVTGQILVRGDSAYGSAAVVAACRRAGARFSLVLTKNTSVAAAIAAIPEHAWTPVQYPGAVRDPDTGAWISDAEVAEIPYTAFASTRQPVQLLMQAALEAEVTEFLGRERYQRAAACLDANEGSRNGYRSVTVKTTTGPVTLERPKLRGTTAAFASRLFGKHVTNTNALETLVIAAFVRGLSVRDVEALAEALGDQAAISKSTVSEVCKAIRAEYQAWARRRLDEIVLDYLFLDASFFRMHPGSPAEPVFGRLGHHHRGQARVRRVVTWDRRVDRCVGRFPDRSARARPWHSAAGRL